MELAADFGQAEAQFQLGLRYRHGEGAARDPDMAIVYFRKAIDQYQLGATCALALCYRDGFGVTKGNLSLYNFRIVNILI